MEHTKKIDGTVPTNKSSKPSINEMYHRIWPIGLIIAGFLIGLTLLLFALANQREDAALVLVVDPPDGLRVIVDGAVVLPSRSSPFLVRNLDPGKHVVTVEKAGYLDQQINIAAVSGERQYRGLLLEKSEGGFTLNTEPPGAMVWIDERPLEAKTPLVTRGISPGTHMVRIAKGNDYAPQTILVDVYRDKVTKVPDLKLQRKIVQVSFESNPPGAVAYLITGNTKKAIGRTPARATLDLSKRYRIRYGLQGYHTMNEEVDIEEMTLSDVSEGEMFVHKTVLLTEPQTAEAQVLASRSAGSERSECLEDRPNRGTLSLQTQPWSRVYIDGEYVKNTPLVAHDIEPGVYDVTVENRAFRILDKFQVSISCGEMTKLTKRYI